MNSASDLFAIIFVGGALLLGAGVIAKKHGVFRRMVEGIVKSYAVDGKTDQALGVINEALMLGLIDLDEAHRMTMDLTPRAQ